MHPYLELLHEIRHRGTVKKQRAVLRSGEKPDALSVFGRQIRFDLARGFPIVTTKLIRFDAIVTELKWYLSGSTNVKYLNDNGVKYWNQWADSDGELGAVYGKQWRAWDSPRGGTVDQIKGIEEAIKATLADPHAKEARRLVLTAWNPADIPFIPKAPPACHTLAHWNITEGKLSCLLYQRSADMFLGVPYNIGCYALLTCLLAKIARLEPGELIHTFGDAHIYWNHLEEVDKQLGREPFPLPRLVIDEGFDSLDHFEARHVRLDGYAHHPPLKGEVAV